MAISYRSARGAAAILLVGLTLATPWFTGAWAILRVFGLAVAPGLTFLLFFLPAVLSKPAKTLAATVLGSAVLTPAGLFLFAHLAGSREHALLFHSALWAVLLAAGLLKTFRAGEPSIDAADWSSSILPLAGAAFVLVLPILLNDDLRFRMDGRTHIAIVREIVENPYPWTDSRYAGQPLRYWWFYNVWASGFVVRGGISPASSLAVLSLISILAYLCAAAALVRRFFPEPGSKWAAFAVVLFGLNPFGLFAVVTHFARAFTGDVTGIAEVARVFENLHWGDAYVLYTLTPYPASMVAWLDKFLVVTSFGIGMAAATLFSLLLWEEMSGDDGGRQRLLLGALALEAAIFQHLVAGFFVCATGGGILLLAYFLRRSPLSLPATLRRLLGMGVLAAVSIPYYLPILTGRESSPGDLSLDIEWIWFFTALTAIGPLLFLFYWGRRDLADRLRGAWAPLGLFLVLALLIILVIPLPTGNEKKFIQLMFVMTAPFGAAGLLRLVRGLSTGWWRRIAGGLAAAGVVMVVALTWFGFMAHREESLPAEVTSGLRWAAQNLPPDAVLIEPIGVNLSMNRAKRDMYVSDWLNIVECGYPREEMRRRTDLVEEIYRDRSLSRSAASRLRELGRPVYLIWLTQWGEKSDSRRSIEGMLDAVYANSSIVIFEVERPDKS